MRKKKISLRHESFQIKKEYLWSWSINNGISGKLLEREGEPLNKLCPLWDSIGCDRDGFQRLTDARNWDFLTSSLLPIKRQKAYFTLNSFLPLLIQKLGLLWNYFNWTCSTITLLYMTHTAMTNALSVHARNIFLEKQA